MDLDALKLMAASYHYDLSDQQLSKLETYAKLLIEYNQKFNLTALTSLDNIYQKHFLDCILSSNFLINEGNYADVGTGAGFPGLVFKLLKPQLKVFLIEANGKKCSFLKVVCETLGLEDVTIINKRIEELSEYREYFDQVSARAVSSINILSELIAPLLKVGGSMLLLRGPKASEELANSKHAFKVLSLELRESEIVTYLENTRHNLLIVKTDKTKAKYPRPYAKIKKDPL